MRYQGGHNAGHTVVVGGERYALQLFPSGVLYDHVVPVIGNGVVVDLPTLFNEIDTLESRGVSCGRLQVSSRAHLIFPWHQAHDAIAEAMRGDDKIGTTLKGIGPAYADKARRVGLRAGDVADPTPFAEHVKARAVAENRELDRRRRRPARRRRHRRALHRPRRPPRALRRRHRRSAPRRPRRRRAPAAGGGAGDVPRPRPRHLSVRHVVQPDRGRSMRRHRARAARHRPGRRDHQGLHDPRRRRAVPHRAHRRRRRSPRRRRPRVRHGHRPPAPCRLARLRDAAPRRPAQQPHRARPHQARRARRLQHRQGVHRLPIGRSPARSLPRSLRRARHASSRCTRRSMAGARASARCASRTDLPAPARALIELVEREVGIPVRVVGVGADRDDYVLWWSRRDRALLDAGDGGGVGRHDALRAVAGDRAAGDRGARRARGRAGGRRRGVPRAGARRRRGLRRRGRRARADDRPRRRRLRRRRAGAHRSTGRVVDPLRPHVVRRRRHGAVLGDARRRRRRARLDRRAARHDGRRSPGRTCEP